MNIKPSLKLTTILLIAIVIPLFLEQSTYGLKPNQSRAETAARRSQNAAKTIRVITGVADDEAIPTELFNRAYAIGVFPDVAKMNLLFSQGTTGYGVICSRQSEVWSLPAYYRFSSSKFNLKVASFKSFDLIILFMNKDTVAWFQSGKLELKGAKAGAAGPIGKLTPQAELDMSKVNLIIYALIDGKLKGMNVASDFLNGAFLDPDNNINKVVYGVKGREILQGKVPPALPTTSEVTAFRDILNEKFPGSK